MQPHMVINVALAFRDNLTILVFAKTKANCIAGTHAAKVDDSFDLAAGSHI